MLIAWLVKWLGNGRSEDGVCVMRVCVAWRRVQPCVGVTARAKEVSRVRTQETEEEEEEEELEEWVASGLAGLG